VNPSYLLFVRNFIELSCSKAQWFSRYKSEVWFRRALQSHICPFLFRAYTPKQAQMPVMLRTTPSKRAIASPASTASTTGTTKSSDRRTNSNCAETDVMMLESWELEGSKEVRCKKFYGLEILPFWSSGRWG
jgi:hypothetical protein